MWTKAEDVPKPDADSILARWDLTTPDVQRMIVLQYILDNSRLMERIKELEDLLHGSPLPIGPE